MSTSPPRGCRVFIIPLQCSCFLCASFRELVVGSDNQSGVTPDSFGGHVLAYFVVVAACQFEPTVSLDKVADIGIHLRDDKLTVIPVEAYIYIGVEQESSTNRNHCTFKLSLCNPQYTVSLHSSYSPFILPLLDG